MCWAERVHTVHLDSLERANCELLLKGLQQSMDSGVLFPFHQMVERAMLHLQESCPVPSGQLPDPQDPQFRAWAEQHFCGDKKTPCFWEHLDSDKCIKRLMFAEPHEYTTAWFINFKGLHEVYMQNFGKTEPVFPKSRDSESHA